ncbi:HTH domain-containing protein [Magnetospirillum sp. 15-1]|uniref:HTH domain-containing protein n=1 Tax=Magnetospirillum sp. 15-1 TaxID=1979370 RepID=UPI000BBC4712|nr:HTH domain-containing protein [Magnetospirillum sp. 15-1]
MDLFDLMSQGREDKALDRLEGMLALYEAENEAEQDEALERARAFCDLEWGSYPAGLEVLARRWATRKGDGAEAAMQALRLHEEGAKPGSIIRAVRLFRLRELTRIDERAVVIQRYGSEEAVLRPTDFELLFIQAASACETPSEVEAIVAAVHPMPASVEAARAESLRWEGRLRHMELVADPTAQPPALPAACAARHRLVEAAWRNGLPAVTIADFSARLEYWAGRGGEDGSGYGVLAADFAALATGLSTRGAGQSTKDRARALKEANPEWSLARIGKELGISRQAVHKHLKGAAR